MIGNLEPGMWVGGYTLVRPLGRGGVGTVWEATDGAGVRVALKLLHPAQAATEEARERLVRQAALVNQIPSQQVAKVLDVEADALVPFVVHELIDGPSVAAVVREQPFTFEGAARLGASVASTLSEVHRRGVAHRDIKPANIVLRNGIPVLIDFDLSRGKSDTTITRGPLLGTPGYVAPELLDNHGASLEQLIVGDWYAWSATLLSSLTGRPPFSGATADQVLLNGRQGTPDAAGLPPSLANAFHAALAADPRGRPQPAELLKALRAANLPQATVALPATQRQRERPPEFPRRYASPSRRHPLVGALFFVLLGAIPALFPWVGLIPPILVIFVLSILGARRPSKGGVASALMLPFRAVWGLLRVVPGALVAVLVAFVSTWAVGTVTFGDVAAADVGDWYLGASEANSFAVWLGAALGLLAFWAAPTSNNLREGIAVTMRSFAPGRLGRLLVGAAFALLIFGAALALAT